MKMMKKKDMVSIHGLMEVNTKGNGQEENKMDLEYI